MTGAEFDLRVRDAMYHKWGVVWEVDLDAPIPGGSLPTTARELIENVVLDCSLIYNGLAPIESFEAS